jgi:hypothetical protein
MTALHHWLNLAGVVLPFLGVIAAIALLWNTLVDWSDLVRAALAVDALELHRPGGPGT